MKICFDGRVFAHSHLTGVERFARELLENLQGVVPVYVEKPPSDRRLIHHVWEHVILPIKCKRFEMFIAPANVGPIVFPEKCKYILVVHDVAFLNFPSAYSKTFRWYYNKVIPLAMKRTDVVITVSESESRNIVKSYPFVKDKIVVIYPGSNSKFHSAQPLPLEQREPYFLYVGSLNPRKNLWGLLKAFAIFKEKTSANVKLKVVGASYSIFNKVNVDSEIEVSDVDYLGYVTEDGLHKLYEKALAFVFPSFYEGFGYPPLEAMSYGTPAVVSNQSSLPEVTKGKAVYVDPRNPEDIADKMVQLVEDKDYWRKVSKEAKEVTKFYTWERTVNEFIKIMESITGQRLQ